MRGRSRGQSMVLLATIRDSECQPRMQKSLSSIPSPAKASVYAHPQRRCSFDPSSQILKEGNAHIGIQPEPSAQHCEHEKRCTARQVEAKDATHEDIVAAYEAKQRAFAAHHRHEHTAMTSPEIRELLPPLQLLQPWLQYQTQLPTKRHRSEKQSGPPQLKRARAAGAPRCIMPGTLHSLAKAARLEPRSGYALRPPAGPSAPIRRTDSALSADASTSPVTQQIQVRRQRMSAVHVALPPRQPLQAMAAAGTHRGPSRSLHGLQCDTARSTDTSPLHSFFSRRSRELRANGSRTRHFRREPSASPPVGLLALPQDVLLLVICKLDHREIGSLFSVCRELRTTMDTAMMIHFNYQTPHHPTAETACDGGSFGRVRSLLPARPAKRSCLGEEDDASDRTSIDGDRGVTTAARALLFDDSAATGGCGGDGSSDQEEVSSASLTHQLEPLSQFSLS